MTDDELRALIAECDASKNGPNHETQMLMVPGALAEIARDALRFRHITRDAERFPDPEPLTGQPARMGWSVQWGMWTAGTMTLREAIDADMEGKG